MEGVKINYAEWCKDDILKENPYNVGEQIIQDHIKKFAKKHDDFILDCLKKQPGFISIEESKHLIEVSAVSRNGVHSETNYIFNGKTFLTIYPTEFNESDGTMKFSFNYRTYDESK